MMQRDRRKMSRKMRKRWRKRRKRLRKRKKRRRKISRIRNDLSVQELFDVYAKEVISILEYAVPVWHGGLTRRQSSEIESVQKLAFRIILRQSYTTYADACAFFNTNSLEQRRRTLCLRFARKNMKSNNSFFVPFVPHPGLRERSKLVQEYKCNTARFRRSSLPFLSSLLNSQP